ncbi:hypothetical protein B0F89_1304 [Malaciobacter marinus]|jgi:hypothetical protein|uniref:Uncharacterized protein n=1 Tax=Malaciobacter marinus TaxID=505249 RepID=A0AB36ZT30_9BACT|nr:hypothetical protein B0F89_1304 [Malaciobacter marinus]SKB72963.1 hypothetical protein SAMN06295997_1369 [Malaciobacter marinus]
MIFTIKNNLIRLKKILLNRQYFIIYSINILNYLLFILLLIDKYV